jgi:hypothetical protein
VTGVEAPYLVGRTVQPVHGNGGLHHGRGQQGRAAAYGVDPAQATLVRLTADGWFYSRLLGFPLL